MKKSIITVIAALLVLALVFAGCSNKADTPSDSQPIPVGDIIAIANSADGVPGVSTSAAPSIDAVEGMDGWALSLLADPTTGMDFYIFEVKAGAVDYPVHDGGDGVWITYITKGSGDVILADADGNETGTQHYKAGDYIIFQPHVFHGWKPSNEDTIMIFTIMQ
ncbi:MAG: cupin domain-containing protein [Clostridiales bacterium]|nr:cupin domain-containing protein [Clostridiales bacterium]